MSLNDLTIHKLRALAQSLSISDVFEKDKKELIQEIEQKSKKEVEVKDPPPQVVIVKPKEGTPDPNDIVSVLEPFIKRGLRVELEADQWHMRVGLRDDHGTMHMPIETILRCARNLFV